MRRVVPRQRGLGDVGYAGVESSAISGGEDRCLMQADLGDGQRHYGSSGASRLEVTRGGASTGETVQLVRSGCGLASTLADQLVRAIRRCQSVEHISGDHDA